MSPRFSCATPCVVRVSRTIASQVMKENVGILGMDVPGSDQLRGVESLAVSEVRSLLCVPLTVFQRMIGCIYLDTTNGNNRLQEEHLDLMTAIAAISAVALDNARRLQWLEQENQRLCLLRQQLIGSHCLRAIVDLACGISLASCGHRDRRCHKAGQQQSRQGRFRDKRTHSGSPRISANDIFERRATGQGHSSIFRKILNPARPEN